MASVFAYEAMQKNNPIFYYFAIAWTFMFASIFVVLLWGSMVSAYDFNYSATQSMYVAEQEIVVSQPEPAVFSRPVRLSIPTISVDAKVEEVGVAKNGTMATPSSFKTVGWYKYGPMPGEIGSAVLDGHPDNGLGLKGVFKRLGELEEGDDIFVYDKDGGKTQFKVTIVDTYEYTKVPVDQIFNENEKPLLRLITCDGRWVREYKTYDTRIIVTAELVR